MADRKLLELAAKAAGISYEFVNEVCIGKRIGSDGRDWPWNPLTDDEDALRLAMALLFEIDMGCGCVAIRHLSGIKILEAFNHDPLAATRRAIVRAAAEIGKTMEGKTT